MLVSKDENIKTSSVYVASLILKNIQRQKVDKISIFELSKDLKKYNITRPPHSDFHPVYKVFKQSELIEYMSKEENLKGSGLVITEFGDKYMMIKWERFKK